MVLSTCRRFILVGEAADGKSGIRMANELSPDVVLCDINMKPLNGIMTTQKILSHNPGLVVIGFSALPHLHQEQEMLDAGAVAVIHKSAGRQEICNTIIRIVEQRRASQYHE